MHGMDVNEEIDYWRDRAKRAEQQFAAVTAALADIRSRLDDVCERCQERCNHRIIDPEFK